MEQQEFLFQDKIFKFIRSNLLILGLFLAGVIFLSIGLIQFFGAKKVAIEFEKSSGLESLRPGGESKIKVDIEGEIIHPGLYELPGDARVQDALIAAGGLTSEANRKIINLAAKIADGQKIYVPSVGETGSVQVLSGYSSSEVSPGGVISVNSATQSELEKLPGIGPVTAGKIIDNRPYGSIEELLSKKVVGKATYEKIKELISL